MISFAFNGLGGRVPATIGCVATNVCDCPNVLFFSIPIN